MKKFCLLFLVTLFTGCTMYKENAKPISATEIMGVKGKQFIGKTYAVGCKGNKYASKDDVWQCVLKKSAEQAKSSGHKYFTILENDAYISTKSGASEKIKLSSTSPSKHKYLKSTNTFTTTILLLDETQLTPWKNIYTTDEYIKAE